MHSVINIIYLREYLSYKSDTALFAYRGSLEITPTVPLNSFKQCLWSLIQFKSIPHQSSCNDTGCPEKHGSSVTNWISSLLWISIVIPNCKSHNIITSARVYFMKRVKDCKDVYNNVSARWTVKTDKFTLFVYSNFLVLPSTPLCSQNINKQNVNIADETLTDYSFLSRNHYTKSKNYLKRRYRISYWIPMFIGTPCSANTFVFKTTFSVPGFSCRLETESKHLKYYEE